MRASRDGRAGRRGVFGWAWALALLLGGATALDGCWADAHMHPETGKAFNRVMARQARLRPTRRRGAEMTGEDADIAMVNFRKGSEFSEIKETRGSGFLLPLQR